VHNVNAQVTYRKTDHTGQPDFLPVQCTWPSGILCRKTHCLELDETFRYR